MNLTRRDFLKVSAGFTGYVITSSAFGLVKVPEALANIGPKVGTETTTICCFCACGCGAIVTTKNAGTAKEKVINLEGDPIHPVNEGALCTKGVAMRQTATHVVPNGRLPAIGSYIDEWDPHAYDRLGRMKTPRNRRLGRALYRAPGGTQWEVVDIHTAIAQIGNRVAATRAAGFETTGDGMTVNRCTNIACLGGAAHDNQECYLLRKLMTGLGLVYIEHQARI